MKKQMGILPIVLVLGLLGVLEAESTVAGTVLQFDRMTGVRAPFVGMNNPIRGVPGGGLPWRVDEARGSLSDQGELEVEVKGLVLADDPVVPEELQLTNPVGNFRAIVSCLSVDSTGGPSTVNVGTDNFPADAGGNAFISAIVELPEPCITPILFVTSSTGNWFATTGR